MLCYRLVLKAFGLDVSPAELAELEYKIDEAIREKYGIE